jgi:hypothetical protein
MTQANIKPDSAYKRICKKVTAVLAWYLLGGTEENHTNPQSDSQFPGWAPPYTSLNATNLGNKKWYFTCIYQHNDDKITYNMMYNQTTMQTWICWTCYLKHCSKCKRYTVLNNKQYRLWTAVKMNNSQYFTYHRTVTITKVLSMARNEDGWRWGTQSPPHGATKQDTCQMICLPDS